MQCYSSCWEWDNIKSISKHFNTMYIWKIINYLYVIILLHIVFCYTQKLRKKKDRKGFIWSSAGGSTFSRSDYSYFFQHKRWVMFGSQHVQLLSLSNCSTKHPRKRHKHKVWLLFLLCIIPWEGYCHKKQSVTLVCYISAIYSMDNLNKKNYTWKSFNNCQKEDL